MGKFQNMFKSLRVREDLSQDEIAAKLGISRSAIGMWEQGRREPDLETMESIADFFNVDMNVLTGNSDETYLEDIQIRQIAECIHNSKELTLLIETVKGMDKERIVAIIEFINKTMK